MKRALIILAVLLMLAGCDLNERINAYEHNKRQLSFLHFGDEFIFHDFEDESVYKIYESGIREIKVPKKFSSRDLGGSRYRNSVEFCVVVLDSNNKILRLYTKLEAE